MGGTGRGLPGARSSPPPKRARAYACGQSLARRRHREDDVDECGEKPTDDNPGKVVDQANERYIPDDGSHAPMINVLRDPSLEAFQFGVDMERRGPKPSRYEAR